MNILYIAPIVPYPLIDGDRQRAYHILRLLTQKHQVHLLCFIRNPREQEALEELKSVCASVTGVPISQGEIILKAFLGWLWKTPLNVITFQKKSMYQCVQALIKKYQINAIHAYRLRMAPYALKSQGVYRVLDYTDSMTRYFINRKKQNKSWLKSFYINHEIKRLKSYEAGISDYLDTCLVSSPQDREVILDQGSASWIEVVSNGVDVHKYDGYDQLTETPAVLFVGNMNYVPNAEGMQWFCQKCWPAIQSQLPDAKLIIVGQLPTGSNDQVQQLYPGAVFKGMADDLISVYKQARVGICPIAIASGRQFKVVEYFAGQLPVVATALVAGNLNAEHEKHLLTADDAAGFSNQVIRLLRDRALAQKLRQAARQLAEEQYDWSKVGKKLHQIYHKLEAAANVQDNSQPGSAAEKMKQHQVLRFWRRI